MKSPAPYKAREPLSLKAAVTAAIADLGGLKAAAAVPGVNRAPNYLHKWGDESEENAGRHIPMDVAVLLSQEAVRRGLAPRLYFWMREQIEHAEAGGNFEISMQVLTARLGREVGEVFAKLATVLDPASPGGVDLDANERRALLKEFEDLRTLVNQGIDKVSGA